MELGVLPVTFGLTTKLTRSLKRNGPGHVVDQNLIGLLVEGDALFGIDFVVSPCSVSASSSSLQYPTRWAKSASHGQ